VVAEADAAYRALVDYDNNIRVWMARPECDAATAVVRRVGRAVRQAGR
jgi:hypothetical protein